MEQNRVKRNQTFAKHWLILINTFLSWRFVCNVCHFLFRTFDTVTIPRRSKNCVSDLITNKRWRRAAGASFFFTWLDLCANKAEDLFLQDIEESMMAGTWAHKSKLTVLKSEVGKICSIELYIYFHIQCTLNDIILIFSVFWYMSLFSHMNV